jgi:hypothetical protein
VATTGSLQTKIAENLLTRYASRHVHLMNPRPGFQMQHLPDDRVDKFGEIFKF